MQASLAATSALLALKKNLRLQVQQRLQALEQSALACSATQVALHLAPLLESASVRSLAAYWPLPLEVDVRPLLADFRAATGQVYLPAVTGPQTMVFRLLEADTPAARDSQGLACPPPASQTIARQQLDMVLLPLRGFDEQGHRLGAGGGYYDRYLEGKAAGTPPYLVGLAFHEQQLDSVPVQAHDVQLDALVLPSGVLVFSESFP